MATPVKKKATARQLEVMVDFMENHLEFARGRLKGVDNESLWNELRKKLNRYDGPTKKVVGWKKTWNYRKSCVKKEVKKLCEQQNLSEKDVLNVNGLGKLEFRILKIIGETDIFNDTATEQDSSSDEEYNDDEQEAGSSISQKSGETPTKHFVNYIEDRLNYIKNDKKRKKLEDEIIDLIRKCTLEDKK